MVQSPRSRTAILSKMLEIARPGVLQTTIMFDAHLSYTQLKEYLSILLEGGLIKHNQQKKHYQTTQKGIEYIKNAENLESFVGGE